MVAWKDYSSDEIFFLLKIFECSFIRKCVVHEHFMQTSSYVAIILEGSLEFVWKFVCCKEKEKKSLQSSMVLLLKKMNVPKSWHDA